MTSGKSQKTKAKGPKPSDRLKALLKREGPFRRLRFVGHNPGDEKISEVVMRFVEPYTPCVETEGEWKNLIAIALIAWNASFFPSDEQKAMMDEQFDRATIFRPDDARRAIYELIERKDRYFADYDQVVVGHDLTMTSEGPYLTVAYLKQRNPEGQYQ